MSLDIIGVSAEKPRLGATMIDIKLSSDVVNEEKSKKRKASKIKAAVTIVDERAY